MGRFEAETVAEGETTSFPYAVLNAHVMSIRSTESGKSCAYDGDSVGRAQAILDWLISDQNAPYQILRRATAVITISGEPTTIQIPVTPTATPTPAATALEGTIRLPERTVGMSLPEDRYVMAEGEAADYVGQYVDLVAAVGYADGTENTSLVVPSNATITRDEDGNIWVTAQDGQEREVHLDITTIFEGLQVVSGGPLLANFSNEQPHLTWKNGVEEWGAITVAVPEDQVSVLEWLINSSARFYILPSEELHGDPVTLDVRTADFEGQGITVGDIVDIVFPTVRRLEMQSNGIIDVTYFEEGDPYTVPYLIPNALVTSTADVIQSDDDPDTLTVGLNVIPQMRPLIVYAVESGIPIELVRRSDP